MMSAFQWRFQVEQVGVDTNAASVFMLITYIAATST